MYSPCLVSWQPSQKKVLLVGSLLSLSDFFVLFAWFCQS